MFLRHTKRKKDGKEHRYWSIVENRRIGGGRVVQRPLLYLGEINDSQELAWRKSIAILEEGALQPRTLSLFPEDRCEGLLPDASIVRLRLNELRLCRPRQWGGCWLALSLWGELELDRFWGGRLPPSRKSLPLRRQGARGGTGCCCCWRPTGCWRRAAKAAGSKMNETTSYGALLKKALLRIAACSGFRTDRSFPVAKTLDLSGSWSLS